jgi:drug/metabolite transporter (DMT)-like permease
MTARPSVDSNAEVRTGLLLATLTTVLWSVNTVVTKAAAGVISPGSIGFYRWLIAFVVLLPFCGRAVWRHREDALRHWWKLAVLAALGMVIYQSLAYVAAATTSAVNMGVLQGLTPLIAIISAGFLAGEGLAPARLVGGGVSLIGLIYLTARGDLRTLAGGIHSGDLLMIVAVFANAQYGVFLRRWRLPLPPWVQMQWQAFFATLMMLPMWLLGPKSPLTAANTPLVLYAALASSLVAPWMWVNAVARLGAGRATMFINLIPILSAVIAVVWLGERLELYHIAGGALCLIGVSIGLYERTPKPI